MICGGVLVPQPNPTTGRFRRCFVEEARKDTFTAKQLHLERDHFVPTSYGGENGSTHEVHAYCQRVQGGSIGGPKGGRTQGRIAADSGHLDSIRTPESTAKGARIRNELYGSPGSGGNHTRWHTNRNIYKPTCELCVAERKVA